MKKNKIITLAELSIKPEFIEEVLINAIQTKDLIVLEKGTEIFNLTRKNEEPNKLVIFAIYTSKEQYEWHLEQSYVKGFFALLDGKLLSAPAVMYLTEV